MGRTFFPPTPEIPGNNGEIIWKEAMFVFDPFDIKGFTQIRIHYEDIYRADDTFSYIPAIRRIRRLTGSDVTDPVLGSDSCYDDFEGWHEKLKPIMTFKILGVRNILMPQRCVKKPPEPFRIMNCYQIDWEVRPCWILQIDENDPSYAYSKRIFYIDKDDGIAAIRYTENYDQKGRPWRSWAFNLLYYQLKTHLTSFDGDIYKDHISGHSSLLDMDPVDYNLDKILIPEDWFTIRGLLKKAR